MDLYVVLEAVARTLPGAELARFGRICNDSRALSRIFMPGLSNKIRFEIYIDTDWRVGYYQFQIIIGEKYYQTRSLRNPDNFIFIPANSFLDSSGRVKVASPKLLAAAEKYNITALKPLNGWMNLLGKMFVRDFTRSGEISATRGSILSFQGRSGSKINLPHAPRYGAGFIEEELMRISNFFDRETQGYDYFALQVNNFLLLLINREIMITDGIFVGVKKAPKIDAKIVDIWAISHTLTEVAIFLVYQPGFILWSTDIMHFDGWRIYP